MKTEMTNPFYKENKLNIPECVNALIRHDTFWYAPEMDEYFTFNGKIYREIPEIVFDKKITAMLGEHISWIDKRKIIEAFKSRVSLSSKSRRLPPEGMINLTNGVLDVQSKKMYPHSSDYFFYNLVPLDFDLRLTCPNWLEFLTQITLGRKCLELVLQELFGYCLIPGNRHQLAFIFYGEGANGKSVVMEILRSLLGVHNTTSLSFSELNDRFKKIELMNKFANISDESPSGSPLESDIFKNLVGEGSVTGEKKGKDPIQFRNDAKLIFSANKIPAFKDHTYAFYRRLLIIPFEFKVDDGKRDIHLIKKLKCELGGILNWALEGLHRLNLQEQFTQSEYVEGSLREFKHESDNVVSFVNDQCVPDQAKQISTDDLFKQYRGYCNQNGLRSVAHHTFGQRLRTHFNIKKMRPRQDGERRYVYAGISLEPALERLSRLRNIKEHNRLSGLGGPYENGDQLN